MANSPPRDLVRFSPFGFSLAVAAVILVVSGGFAVGYLWGIRSERNRASAAVPATVVIPPLDFPVAGNSAAPADSPATVTFYSELAGESKKPSSDVSRAPSPPVVQSRKEREAGEVPPRATSGKKQPEGKAPAATPQALMVQVASYPAANQAQEMKSVLDRKGYHCEVQEADLGVRGKWYRVRVGPFQGEAQAQQAISRIQRELGLKGYVVP